MADHVAGKSIIITGAGNGFGKIAANRLGALGARLACLDINGDAAEATAKAIRNCGGEAIGVIADVISMDDMRRAVDTAAEAFGAIDVMVNNAGIMPLAFIADHATALPAWERCIDINFRGVMHGTVAVFDRMMAQGRGQIINISSIYGNHPVAGAAVYGATKAAVDYFSHAARLEARGKIKVTVIKPTGVLATGLAATVVNPGAGQGILGGNLAAFYEDYHRIAAGEAPPELTDPDSIGCGSLAPEYIADAIIHAIAQPWGVAISDMTVRASGDHFIL